MNQNSSPRSETPQFFNAFWQVKIMVKFWGYGPHVVFVILTFKMLILDQKLKSKGISLFFLGFFWFNPILHGGGSKRSPRLIIVQQSSWNALNRLIFHEFVPCNIFGISFWNFQKILRRQFFPRTIQRGDPSMPRFEPPSPAIFFVLFWVKNGNNSTPNA